MSSSRLIVKNLPKKVNEEKVRSLFSQKGEITDVKLVYNEEGKFRQFGFVGFRTAEQATEAQKYFDKNYMGSAKISVEVCTNLGEKPKPVSKVAREKLRAEAKRERESKESSEEEDEEVKPAKRKRKEDEILEKCEQDPAFMEFLQTHKKNAATWGNDNIVDELQKLKNKKEELEAKEKQKKDKKGKKGQKDGEEAKKTDDNKAKKKDFEKEFLTLKLRDVPKKAKKKDIKGFFAPLKLKSIRFPRGVRGVVFVGVETEDDLEKGLQKNKSILFGNQIRIRNYSSNDGQANNTGKSSKWKMLQEDLEKEADPIRESGRLFIRNLPYTTNEDEITKMFQEFGPLTEVHLPIDKISRKLKGIGFVSFMLPEHAENAHKALDGTIFQGRMLHILPAKSQEDLNEKIDAGSSYKTQKEQKIKKTAGSSHNWNALFLGTSAVSKVISEKYGISREEMLLDKTDEGDSRLASVGVRMALAETEIVSDTKKFLEDNGVCLAAFDSNDKKAERSKTVLLAKNLPVGTASKDLQDLFCKHGILSRIVLPQSGITGIVEFTEPAEARAAFKKLAYTNFFGLPLYLEWAPIGVFSKPADPANISKLNQTSNTHEDKLNKDTGSERTEVDQEVKKVDNSVDILKQIDGLDNIDKNSVPEPDTTLFVKNLNFRTKEDSLKKHFRECGPIYTATVARRKDPNNSDTLLSMGYGFVQFYRSGDTQKALQSLHDTMLDNHLLDIKRSARTLVKDSPNNGEKKKENGTKILVRNVPFLATQDEITDLFKTFGNLKAVRLPKKLTGSGEHRGFAFIEFYSETDAKKAFDTLGKSTHLYGRRLVLEWASQDESIEDLRAKTARLATASSKSEDDSGVTGGGSTKKKLHRYFQTHAGTSAKASSNNSDDEED